MDSVGMPGIPELIIIGLIALFLFGVPLAVVVAVVMMVKKNQRRSPDPANLTTCPDCGGTVSRRAAACPHCGSPLQSAP